jgi:hypothetical protein
LIGSKRVPAAVLALALAACSTDESRMRSDWERENEGRLAREETASAAVPLPPPPREADLVEFEPGGAVDFRFFVDRGSISVTDRGIVRYTLVASSPNGVRNVTYEALNCRDREMLVHATARMDGTWNVAQPAWRPAVRPWHRALLRDFFCPKGLPITSAAEGASALAQGGHALARQPDPVSGGR